MCNWLKITKRPSLPNVLVHSVRFKMADGANEEVVKKEEENASEEKPELEEAKSELQDDTNRE